MTMLCLTKTFCAMQTTNDWIDENCEEHENSMGSSENLVELIEVDDEWQCENFEQKENNAMSSSDNLVELIEVDEDWLDECDNKSGNCGSNEMDVEEIEFDGHESKDESTSNEGDASNEGDTSNNEIELIEVPEPDESDENQDEFDLERIGRIVELKMSLTELKDNSSFTKRGLERKRRTFKLPPKERAIKKLQLKQACDHDSCNSNFSKNRRLEINTEFWNMGFSERYTLGFCTINREDIKQRRKNTQPLKNNSYQYYLKNNEGKIQQFHQNSNGKTRYQLSLPRLSNQGNHLKPRKEDYETIISHINSFDPNISHHRRENAPKKKYLPNNLTIRSMHDKFKRKFPDIKCSYYLYRRIVSSELNISFTKLGHEQCETCEEYDLHVKSVPICDSCDLCEEYEFHKIKYTESRALYNDQRELNTERKAYTSGDMEKVIMLPRLEMFKTNIFSTRLAAYNDTFAPLGGRQFNPPTLKPVAVIWHEGISGRCKEVIISAFYKFFIHRADVEEHVMWLDNCSSQNKNWALLCFLVYIINSNLIKAHQIQFNYFEPGHTFMAADSFHHQVELSMKEMEKVYNFEDFEKAVSNANAQNVTVLSMEATDFKNWIDCSSRAKKTAGEHYLHEMVQITAIRGSYDLIYKKSFSSPEEFHLDFLQEKYKVNGIPPPVAHTTNCGISVQRKANILATDRIIPENKIDFWKNISVIDESSSTENTVPRRKICRQNKERKSLNQQQKSLPRKSQATNTRRESAQNKKCPPKKCPPEKCPPKKCPPEKCPPKKCPPKKCPPKKCPPKKCPPEKCPPKKCPPKQCPPKKCPPKQCPPKKCPPKKCPPKKCPPEKCPPKNRAPEKCPPKQCELKKYDPQICQLEKRQLKTIQEEGHQEISQSVRQISRSCHGLLNSSRKLRLPRPDILAIILMDCPPYNCMNINF